MDVESRFWAKVLVLGEDECWIWQAGQYGVGYGCFSLRGKACGAHTVALELDGRPVPPGMVAMHLCELRYAPGDTRYRLCVNPLHLEVATYAANTNDAYASGHRVGRRSLDATQAAKAVELWHAGWSLRAIGDALEIDHMALRRTYLAGVYEPRKQKRRFGKRPNRRKSGEPRD